MKKPRRYVLLTVLILQILFIFRNSIPKLMDTASHVPVTTPPPVTTPSSTAKPSTASAKDKDFSTLDSSLRYAALSQKQKKVYKMVQNAITKHASFVNLEYELMDEKEFLEVWKAVRYTDPLLLATGALENEFTYGVNRQKKVVSVQPKFELNKKTTKKYLKSTRKQVKKIAANTDGMNDRDKAKYFHDYLILHASYSTMLEEKVNHSAYHCLVNGYSVCDGYASAFKLLCDEAQIPCDVVLGQSNGGNHAWNLIQLDGAWYHVDVTFDDPVGMPEDYVGSQYFCLTTAEILKDHTIDPDETFPMP